MRRLLFVLFLVLLALPGYCEGLIYYQDDTATDTLRMIPVSDSTPLPTSALVTIGSVTVDPAAPVANNGTDIVSVTSSAQSVTSLANRKSLMIINHSSTETIWVSLDSAVASATVGSSIPIFPYGYIGRELDSAKIIGLVTSSTATATVYQDGY